MFNLKNNKKIGCYLQKLILKKYKSQREFCKRYCVLDNQEISEDNVNKLANRLSQIIKGTKGIQIYDLPIFTKLLEVSCEQILSCGDTCIPIKDHITNYQIALSKDENEWKKYIECKEKLILNLLMILI